ncbi:hypothetical protein [Streptomyces sp. JJ36]|uniref:hypothetical protein n=1 Tax=Streptomyces sp. JJ36 TaxID=2736645 RepID=UPI001F419740|nr:hypothetical protein [Streptomyces sp. JJ36]
MAPEAAAVHRALDGVRYRLRGALDLSAPATSAAEVVVGGQLFEFTAGPAGLGDDMAASLGIDAFDTELRFRGGTLHTATTSTYDPGSKLVENPVLVVWRGRHTSLVTRFYRATTADVLGLLRTVRLTEHDDGLVLEPEPGADCRLAGPAGVVQEVPGLGLLEMTRRTGAHTRRLPPWQGHTTPSGELFRDTLTDGSPFFVLSGDTLWATVVPLAGTDPDRVPGLLDRCTLDADTRDAVPQAASPAS